MINEIVVWFVIVTGVVMPIILGYVLTVVMKLDKKMVEIDRQMTWIDAEHVLLATEFHKGTTDLTTLQLEQAELITVCSNLRSIDQTLFDGQDILERRYDDLEERVNQLDIIVTHNTSDGHNKQIATLEKQVRRLFAMQKEPITFQAHNLEAKSMQTNQVITYEPELVSEILAVTDTPKNVENEFEASKTHLEFLLTVRTCALYHHPDGLTEKASEAIRNGVAVHDYEDMKAVPRPALVCVGNDFAGLFAEWLSMPPDHPNYPKEYRCEFQSHEQKHTIVMGKVRDLDYGIVRAFSVFVKDAEGTYTEETLTDALHAQADLYNCGWYVLVASEVYSAEDTNLKHWDVTFTVTSKRKYARQLYRMLKEYMYYSCWAHRISNSDYTRQPLHANCLNETFTDDAELKV